MAYKYKVIKDRHVHAGKECKQGDVVTSYRDDLCEVCPNTFELLNEDVKAKYTPREAVFKSQQKKESEY